MNITFIEATYQGINGWHGFKTGQKYLLIVRMYKPWFKMVRIECWRAKESRYKNGYYRYRSIGTFLTDFDVEKII